MECMILLKYVTMNVLIAFAKLPGCIDLHTDLELYPKRLPSPYSRHGPPSNSPARESRGMGLVLLHSCDFSLFYNILLLLGYFIGD